MNEILHEEQIPIAEDLYRNLSACELYNIPTGRGKTFILLSVGKKVISDDKKKVIISVPNNYLVREMKEIAEKYFGFSNATCGIKIGIENYIDRNRMDSFMASEEFDTYCDKEEVEAFLEEHKKESDLFFDDFFKAVSLKEIASEGVVKNLLCRQLHTEEEGQFKKLTITNHYYLLSKSIYSKDFNIGDYALLVDEVHELSSVAEQIMTDSFSIFEYKNILHNIKKEIKNKPDFHGKIKALSTLQTQVVRANSILKKSSVQVLSGEYHSRGEGVEKIRESCRKLLQNKEHVYIDKKLGQKVEGFGSFFSRTRSFSSALSSLENTSSNILYGVYYSPSKGYPTLRTSSGNPLGRISKMFWDKVDNFAGVSGSVTCSLSPTLDELRYGYSRLGMLRKDDDRKIHFYDRTFPKENITLYLAEKEFYGDIKKDNVFSEDFDPENSAFYQKIVDFVADNHENKNTIVLCGGYKECKYLSELYALKHNSVNILSANINEKTFRTVEKFKQQGGILFATKNYGLGLSLEGKLLEKLFILKLPYQDYTTKKWQDLKSKSMGLFSVIMEREMLITLIQNLGRVPRTKEDKGDIYLLDYGYAKTKRKEKVRKKILEIVEQYGVFRSNEIKIQKKKKKTRKMEELFL